LVRSLSEISGHRRIKAAEKVPSITITSAAYIGSLASRSEEYEIIKDSGTTMKEAKKETINAKAAIKILVTFKVFE
jgi:hypothetical protein